MCFNNDDYDWTAEVCEVQDGPRENSTTCYECNAPIAAGEWRRVIEMQEYEQCQRCEAEDLAEGELPCDHDGHERGESFGCSQCRDCVNLIAAIEAVERDEGCPPHARQPHYGELLDAIYDDGDGRYVHRAVAMFPSLASVPHIRELIL